MLRMPPRPLLFATAVAVLCAATSGLGFGYSSATAFRVFLSVKWNSIFASSLNVGGLVGSVLSGYLLSRKGRRWTLFCACLPGIIGWIWLFISADAVYQSYSPSALFILGRILTGVSAGMIIPSAAAYLIEIAPPEWHGVFGVLPQIGIVSGITVAYVFAAILPWERAAFFDAVILLVLLLLLLILPESPKWLARSGYVQQASAAQSWLYGTESTVTEMEQLKSTEEGAVDGVPRLVEYVYPCGGIPASLRSRLRVVLLLMVLQQLSGVNAILYFAESVCMFGGSLQVSTCTILLGVSQQVFTVLSVYLINRASRKQMLCWSSIIMASAHVLHALFLPLASPDNPFGELSKCCIVIFLLGFSIGWGPLPIFVTLDLFSTAHRGFATGAGVALNWIASFLVTLMFEPMNSVLGPSAVLLIFAAFCLVGWLFVRRYVPETPSSSC
ncbi:unnamed protein product [Calicophoron daubneyi]|uniref:Major facilitator superfamily (MFS) profile domain-containing protein n=1 Tax=Calicophoron daubneyi TaxID=300641 RepID=A0AAV2TG26_CALDB